MDMDKSQNDELLIFLGSAIAVITGGLSVFYFVWQIEISGISYPHVSYVGREISIYASELIGLFCMLTFLKLDPFQTIWDKIYIIIAILGIIITLIASLEYWWNATGFVLILTGGITGISQILQQMVDSAEKIGVIDHEDKKLIFEYGNGFTIVLITKSVLKILKTKLESLKNEIFDLFGDVIPTWDGNMDIFLPVRSLIKNYFSE